MPRVKKYRRRFKSFKPFNRYAHQKRIPFQTFQSFNRYASFKRYRASAGSKRSKVPVVPNVQPLRSVDHRISPFQLFQTFNRSAPFKPFQANHIRKGFPGSWFRVQRFFRFHKPNISGRQRTWLTRLSGVCAFEFQVVPSQQAPRKVTISKPRQYLISDCVPLQLL
jgi:hypothetical protein